MKKIAIIGAGITGLFIADILSKKGRQVTVIEKTAKVGGMSGSFRYKDYILDYGPHKFYTQLPGINEEFKRIVGEENYLTIKKKNSIRLMGKYYDFPIKMGQLLTGINPAVAFKIGIDFMGSFLGKKEVRIKIHRNVKIIILSDKPDPILHAINEQIKTCRKAVPEFDAWLDEEIQKVSKQRTIRKSMR